MQPARQAQAVIAAVIGQIEANYEVDLGDESRSFKYLVGQIVRDIAVELGL